MAGGRRKCVAVVTTVLLVIANAQLGRCLNFLDLFTVNESLERPAPQRMQQRSDKAPVPTNPYRRIFNAVGSMILPDLWPGKKEIKKNKEYETYYVEVPPYGYEPHEQHYDHSEGVKVWEMPTIWDGHLKMPNLIPHAPEPYDHPVVDSKERFVEGWDTRWGIRVAVPYVGDFQYLREVGPGDFIPELGPGKFEYPGPGEVDDPGQRAYKKVKPHKKKPLPPILDLTPYKGLKNYPWYK